jgi:hypothetical protein
MRNQYIEELWVKEHWVDLTKGEVTTVWGVVRELVKKAQRLTVK